MREESWLARTALGYAVLRYEDVVGILRERRFHQAASKIAELSGITDPEFLSRRRVSLLTAEGDEHARLRRLVAPAFTPKAADRLRPFMREVVDQLVDAFAGQGRTELMADLCEPYPIPIICELLGAPKEDWKLFAQWAPDILRIFNFNIVEDLPIIMKAQDELSAYALDLIADRRTPARRRPHHRADPGRGGGRPPVVRGAGDDVRGRARRRHGHHPQPAGVRDGAARRSTPTSGRCWASGPSSPAAPSRRRCDCSAPSAAPPASPREDVEYRGVIFPEGTLVTTSFVGSNTDPTVFGDPLRFDITREGSSPQLTFGSGIHYCLGAWLARAELQEALAILAKRLPGLALDGPIEWKPNTTGIWGPARLRLRFDPT